MTCLFAICKDADKTKSLCNTNSRIEERTECTWRMTTRQKKEITSEYWLSSRREFLAGLAALGVVGWADKGTSWAKETPGWSGLPNRPEERPLDFHALASAFDAWVMDPTHGLNTIAKDGRQVFPSALEGEQDGGLTTYAPMALGKELRGEGLPGLGGLAERATSANCMDCFSTERVRHSASTGT